MARCLLVAGGIAGAHAALAALPVPQLTAPVNAAAPLAVAVQNTIAPLSAPIQAPVADAAPTSPAAPASLPEASPAAIDEHEVECVAKVIVHEAGNQPRIGQVAVAQVIRARMRSGRFARSACGVVHQQGQFFDIDAYDPPRSSKRWTAAAAIAAGVLNGGDKDVAPGALFFQNAAAPVSPRARIAQIADHVFYR